MKTHSLCVAVLLLISGLTLPAAAQFSVTNATTAWTPIGFGNTYPDFYDDEQTGDPEADIVGTTNNPSFYTQFDDAGTPSLTDGTLAYRVRLGGDKGTDGKFKSYFFVGMDADGNGSLDVFLGVGTAGSKTQIGIWDPGTGANISPSTTSIESPPDISYNISSLNFSFTPVSLALDPTATSTDLDGDTNTDVFLSFAVPFADVVNWLSINKGISLTETSVVSYVSITSQQDNALNQDLNGHDGDTGRFDNSTATWGQLGGLSDPFTAGGLAIPEPSALTLAVMGLLMLGLVRRRRA